MVYVSIRKESVTQMYTTQAYVVFESLAVMAERHTVYHTGRTSKRFSEKCVTPAALICLTCALKLLIRFTLMVLEFDIRFVYE